MSKLSKKIKHKKTGYKYRIVDGVRKRVYRTSYKAVSSRKKSLYSKFSSNVSEYLKQEGLSWREFGDSYPRVISGFWSEAKATFKSESELIYAIENIESSFRSFIPNVQSSSERVELLDSIDGSNWWNFSDELREISFGLKDTVTFKLNSRVVNLDGIDLTLSSNVLKVYNELTSKITTKNMSSSDRERMTSMGVPNSSDMFVSVKYNYDAENDVLNAEISIDNLDKYLNYHYTGSVGGEYVPVDNNKSKKSIDESVSDYDKEIELLKLRDSVLDKEFELIKMYKSIGLTDEQIKKRLGF